MRSLHYPQGMHYSVSCHDFKGNHGFVQSAQSLDDVRCIACDCCLQWFHYHCQSLSTEPSSTTYFLQHVQVIWFLLHCMEGGCSLSMRKLSVRLSVRLSVKRVNCAPFLPSSPPPLHFVQSSPSLRSRSPLFHLESLGEHCKLPKGG